MQFYKLNLNSKILLILSIIVNTQIAKSSQTLLCSKSHISNCFLDPSYKYDVIIVGGGAAGCSLARTLADANQSVLLIERGSSRNQHKYTLDAEGAGWVVNDPSVSQLVVTSDEVRSHIGSVLSGGTGINFGVAIAESDDFLSYMELNEGVQYNHTLFHSALDWSLKLFSNPQPPFTNYNHAWKKALGSIFKSSFNNQQYLQKNASWEPYILFNHTENNKRLGADIALGLAGVDWPETLHVLTDHTVDKITMEYDGSSYRAECVIVHKRLLKDIAPIQSKSTYSLLNNILSFFKIREKPKIFSNVFQSSNNQFKICIKSTGKIVSSAGAILTPLLLFRSGIGPLDSVKNSNAPHLINLTALGENLRDRTMLPLSFFFKRTNQSQKFPITICHSVGLGYFGDKCHNLEYNISNPDCFVLGLEEISGARAAAGTIYATRILFPPSIRQEPLIDFIIKIIVDCEEKRIPLGNPFLLPACLVAEQISSCFRRVATQIYFTAEPKSTGSIKVLPSGLVNVTGNYLKMSDDLVDAMRGVTALINQINEGPYEDIFEEFFPNSCPLIILRSLLLLLNKKGLRKQIESSSISDDSITKVETYISEQMNQLMNQSNLNFPFNNRQNQCFRNEEYCSEENWRPFLRPFKPYTQKYGSFPPVLPDSRNFTNLKDFVTTYMTSMWHWVGSAPMGFVVDSNFKVYGTSNLHIVDASVLNVIPRMNPTISVISLGRYAGLKIIQNS